MATEVSFVDYFAEIGPPCNPVNTERKLIMCDTMNNTCLCPSSPAVVYFKDTKQLTYVPEPTYNVFKFTSLNITNNTEFTVLNAFLLINDVMLALNVPGTGKPITSGETESYDLYIPYDLAERVEDAFYDIHNYEDEEQPGDCRVDFGILFDEPYPTSSNMPNVSGVNLTSSGMVNYNWFKNVMYLRDGGSDVSQFLDILDNRDELPPLNISLNIQTGPYT